MKSKQICALVGAIVLVVAFVWWGSVRDVAKDANEDTNQAVTPTNTTNTTQNRKPSSSTSRVPSSVNPTVVPEKPVPVIPTPMSLAGSTFKLTTYNGTNLPSDSKFTLTFTENSFTLKLCNTLSSNYYISNNNIKASNVISTAMYCSSPQNIMKIESDASMMLNSGLATIYRSGSTLILSHSSGIVLAFEGF